MLGYGRNKWTAEEEGALIAGVCKHGAGEWLNILEDPEFRAQLLHRSNIDIKDKWRNMKIKERAKTQTLESASIVISPCKDLALSK